jgi:two-component system, OmpR family, sensor histidine kinase VanS
VSIRLRLTLIYAGLLVGCTTLLLGMSWWVLGRHLERTLPDVYADDVLRRLLGQYAIAVAGAALLAFGLGWAAAGRALAPVRRIASAARRVSQERPDERIALGGPDDELRELSDTLDDMLDRLQGAYDAQRRFVANASHELRSPLTVIRTETEVTLADPASSERELREMGRVVLEATDRTEALLDGLLTLALGQQGPRRQNLVDLAEVCARVVASVRPEAAERGVRVSVDAARAVVGGDEQLLERLVANLVENAVRHNERGGVACLEVEARDGLAVLRTVNGGPRIPPDVIERLVEPFQRLDRSAGHRGSGLGLSIVRTVAEAHGGELRLAARPGGGLEAVVELPLAASSPAPSHAGVLTRS